MFFLRENSDIYGPWKKKNLAEIGIVIQCIVPTRINDQYLTNVLPKINLKLGDINLVLAVERYLNIPLITKIPTDFGNGCIIPWLSWTSRYTFDCSGGWVKTMATDFKIPSLCKHSVTKTGND